VQISLNRLNKRFRRDAIKGFCILVYGRINSVTPRSVVQFRPARLYCPSFFMRFRIIAISLYFDLFQIIKRNVVKVFLHLSMK